MRIQILSLFFIGIALAAGGVILLTEFVVETEEVEAGTSNNISGWAWSENIGWISFNSIDCDIDGDGTYEGAGEAGGPAPAGCPATGTAFDYGVDVNITTGAFLGYAWSETIGWIKFDPTTTPPGEAVAAPATLDLGTNEVSGWARACAGSANPETTCEGGTNPDSGGWDGWIKLRKDPADAGSDYGVNWNSGTGEFEGWAWGSDVVGWISFNNVDCDADNDGSSDGVPAGCPAVGTPISDYQVVKMGSRAPSADNLTVDLWKDNPAFCGQSTPPMRVSWNFVDPDLGDQQDGYQIEVYSDINFSNLLIDTCDEISASTCDFGGASGAYVFQQSGRLLSWDQIYYWRLKVWDSQGLFSDWIYPPSPTGSPTLEGSADSFDTPPHAYPEADNFVYSPVSPLRNEPVEFDDDGDLNSFDGVPFDPLVDPLEASWEWDFGDGSSISPGPNPNPIHIYAVPGVYTVTLSVQDDVGKCSAQKNLVVSRSNFLQWKEVSPF